MRKENGRRIGKQTRGLRNEDDKVWLTMGTDSIPLLYVKGLISPEMLSRVSRMRTNSTVIATTSYNLAKISRIMENRHGFGGFLVHGSEAEAREFSRKVEKNCVRNQVAFDYTIDNSLVAKHLSRNIFKDNLEKIVSKLSTGFVTRDFLTEEGIRASKWIKELWEAISSKRNDINVNFFEHDPSLSNQSSIIATIEGSAEKHSIVILGAHIDSINRMWGEQSAPGADDNASGVSILTELLRVIVETGYVPEKTIQLMGYAAEERPSHVLGSPCCTGSRDIALQYSNGGKNVIGALNLDMSGHKGSKQDIYIIENYANPTQNEFLEDLSKRYMPELSVGHTKCGYACSDHFSWCIENVPSSYVFESTFIDFIQHGVVHTAADSKVEADHILKFAKLAAVYVAELAKGSVDP